MAKVIQVVQVMGEHDLAFHFTGRTQGDIQITGEISICVFDTAFCNVTRYGYRCSPQLACQTIDFMAGKRFSGFVNFEGQSIGFLPDNDIAKTFRPFSSQCSTVFSPGSIGFIPFSRYHWISLPSFCG